jgi:aspartyl-tRNA(Asn)/glutamyl-tRNA(Gln) amidotransferase subunit B
MNASEAETTEFEGAAKGYKLTVGLEVHAELNTETKMFCSCANDPEAAKPNANICPICMAHPGTIPTINKKAVEHVLRVGTAIGANLADYTEFDRKSYFYPDIPKGYQISQFEHPFVAGGSLVGINVTRIHLEEDTARSSHEKGKSLVDFNRAGVPLMELVTEPDIHDAATAGKFARELQLLLRTLGASNANLEKGEMRVEANISISKTDELGTKVEVKNLNSFRSVERAIAYEVERQAKLIEEGGKVTQETRGWDENKQITFSQRVKEGSADYRYFPAKNDRVTNSRIFTRSAAGEFTRTSVGATSSVLRARVKRDGCRLPWGNS